ncbi:uncharacterized protein K02A2.6-like [Galendromus occidentalis]|uniref:Uncharacterized protein K02A2.6-like n=1 Tax=Galendromus occidentalis TaxID=34638 RepID=A0AAJ6W0N1_9ACAR|nr:uncharacterized protein K02A2.6-like [Galendromus occidentalis]
MEEVVKKLTELLEVMSKKQDGKVSISDDRVVALNNVLSLVGIFKYDPDNGITFERWFRRNGKYLDSHCNSEEERLQLLLKALGPKEYNQLRGRTSPAHPEDKTYTELVAELKSMFGESKSLFRRRHDTLSVRHAPGKLVEEIVNSTKLYGDDFEFSKLTLDNFNIFIMLLHLSDPSYKNLRGVIMRAVDEKPDIKLEDLRTVMRRYETRTVDTQVDQTSNRVEGQPAVFGTSAKKGTPHPSSSRNRANTKKPQKSLSARGCVGCADDHPRRECPFKNSSCNACKKIGHIAKVCRSMQSNQVQVHSTLNQAELDEGRTFVKVTLNGKIVKFRADSGADISTINLETWKALGSPPLDVYGSSCTHVDGGTINVKGYFDAEFGLGNRSVVEPLLVLASGKVNLLCGRLLKQLHLVTWNFGDNVVVVNAISAQVLETKFPDLFKSGLGTCTKLKVHLHLRNNVVPVHLRPRSVALALQEPINQELDRLVKNGTLVPVDTSEWATPIVVVKKPNEWMPTAFSQGEEEWIT